jgi:hypothetical protein
MSFTGVHFILSRLLLFFSPHYPPNTLSVHKGPVDNVDKSVYNALNLALTMCANVSNEVCEA